MKPYYERDGITIYHADCRDVLPTLAADVVYADPPYGVGKAVWDATYTFDWLEAAADAAQSAMIVTPGLKTLLDLPPTVGVHTYRWTLAAHITNGRCVGALGFANWIPFVLYSRDGVRIHQNAQDSFSITIRGTMPDHPSPKPIEAMRWLFARIPGETVLDPFMGSGTTLVVAKEQRRKAIGIEIEERYCEIAARRLEQSVLPLAMAAERGRMGGE
jgi:site-specific DNA-methyltransferase (adenine-specific)